MSELAVADLTPLGMYRNADVVVQAILLSLLAASVASWTVLFAKALELGTLRLGLRQLEADPTLLLQANAQPLIETPSQPWKTL